MNGPAIRGLVAGEDGGVRGRIERREQRETKNRGGFVCLALSAVLLGLSGCGSATSEVPPPPLGEHLFGETPLALYFPTGAEDWELKVFLVRQQLDTADHSFGGVASYCLTVEGADPSPEFLALFASRRGPKVVAGSKCQEVRYGTASVSVKTILWRSRDEAYAECGCSGGNQSGSTREGWYLKRDGRWIPLEASGLLL